MINKKKEALACEVYKIELESWWNEEKRLRRKQVESIYEDDWFSYELYNEQLVEVYSQLRRVSRAIFLFEEKMKFQQKLQEQYGDSRLVVVHEYIPDIDLVKIKFQIKSKHVDSQIHITPMVPSHDDIQEPCKEEVVQGSCEEVVETSCVEIVHDLEEVVETSCMEDVGSTKECVHQMGEET